jgi:TRAP-type C4-dicarboxylate transport system permease large subunit
VAEGRAGARQHHRVGHIRGDVGTAIADAAGLGTTEIKAMKDKGYDLGFR